MLFIMIINLNYKNYLTIIKYISLFTQLHIIIIMKNRLFMIKLIIFIHY